MIIKLEKSNLFGVLLLFDVCVQLACILINIVSTLDSVNYFLFVNNYIICGLIIVALVVKGACNNFLAISFFGCYLLFLMGQKPFQEYYDVFLTFSRVKLDTKQYLVFSTILFIGLSITYFSYIFFYLNYSKSIETEDYRIVQNNKIKKICMFLFCITLPFALYMQLKIVVVKSSVSYTTGYLINVYIPSFIKIAYYIFYSLTLFLLALKPTKKQLFFIISAYIIIEGGVQLFQGRRALFASTILFTAWYLIKYFKIENMKLKYIIPISIVFTGMIILFYIVEQLRDTNSTKLSFDSFRRFFVSTGGSDSVIANTIYRKYDFQKPGILYLLDPLVNNSFFNIILKKNSYAQGIELLQSSNSFSHWISFMTNSYLYLSGHGMGSCYLAEVYLAFGLFGILIISVLLGFLLYKLNQINFNNNILKTAIMFFVVRYLFTLPRSGLLSWIGNIVYVFFTYFILLPFYKEKKQ